MHVVNNLIAEIIYIVEHKMTHEKNQKSALILKINTKDIVM